MALLVITILGIMMSWGKYLPGFNTFLFDHLPMYNKFRPIHDNGDPGIYHAA
jgi:hypothetical protein